MASDGRGVDSGVADTISALRGAAAAWYGVEADIRDGAGGGGGVATEPAGGGVGAGFCGERFHTFGTATGVSLSTCLVRSISGAPRS